MLDAGGLGYGARMKETNEHYTSLLALRPPWRVQNVRLSHVKSRLFIEITYHASSGACPVCGGIAPVYDRQPARTWRHLDTMQFETWLSCATPRVNCPQHGVKNIAVPWAGKHSRFTLLFEAKVIRLLLLAGSVEGVRKELRLSWHQVDDIKARAVARGLERRGDVEVPWLGLDEKSFRSGQSYICVMNDLEEGRVLDVSEGREEADARRLLEAGLSLAQREKVCAVAVDMAGPFIRATQAVLPDADIVHDRFHVAKHLNEAVNSVRHQENRQLRKEQDRRLERTKYIWLRNPMNWRAHEQATFDQLKDSGLQVAKAWRIKELFRHFWERADAHNAERYFQDWFQEAMKSALRPIQQAARMLKRHLPHLLTYFQSYITNAVSEGLNSKIQALKAAARGYRSFANYRISILFHCGKLHLLP